MFLTFELLYLENKQLIMGKIAKYQKDAAPLVKQLLQGCNGVQNAMSSKRIIEEIKEKGINLRDSCGVRKVIQYLRIEDSMINLVSNNRGYYIELDPVKLKEYAEGMRARAQPMIEVAKLIESSLKKSKKKESDAAQITMFV